MLVRRSVLGVFIYGLALLGTGVRPGYAFPVAKLRNLRPIAEIKGGKKGWLVARERGSLVFGDHVRTGPRGAAQIVFLGSDTNITLRANTEVEVKEPETASQPLAIRLIGAIGEVFIRSKGHTEVRTAAGIAATGGTEYSVRLDSADQTTVTVSEGHIVFFNPQGTVTVAADEQSMARVGTAPTLPVRVNAAGLLAWTGDVAGLPLPFELPASNRDPQALQNAKSLLQQGNARGGEAAFRALLDSPQADEAQAGVALSLLSNRDRTGAAAVVEGATTPLASAVRALLLLENNDARGAQTLLAPLAAAPGAPFQVHTLLALAQIQNADVVGAERSATRAVELAPTSAGARATLSLAQFFANTKDGAALKNARRAVELDPFSPLALLALGRVEAARGNLDEGRQALEQAVSLSPELPGAQRDLGALELALDRLPRAERALRASLASQPDDARTLAALGTVLLRHGDRTGAKENLDRAVELAPADPYVRANRAAFLVENGDLDAAAREGDFYFARQNTPAANTPKNAFVSGDDPTLGALLIRLSESALFRQQLDEAQRYANEAVRLLPGSAPARYQLARVFLEQGRTTQAEQGFQLALVLDPDFADARYALGLVREGRGFAGSARITGQIAAALEASQARTFSFQDLSSPGSSERIQAVLQNLTVFRSASRSFGDSQIDGSLSESGTNSGSFSFARELNKRRSAIGLNLAREEDSGIRPSAASRQQDATIQFGQKSNGDSSGIWALASWQRLQPSFDTQETSSPAAAQQRVNIEKPTLLVGGKFGNRNAQTRVLLDADRTHYNSILLADTLEDDFKALHGEIRHDRRLTQNVSLILGWSLGQRRLIDASDSVFNAPTGTVHFLTNNDQRARAQTGYARAVWTPSSQWRVEAEMRYRRLNLAKNSSVSVDPPDPNVVFPPNVSNRTVSAGLPGLVVLFRPSQSTTLRLRSRRTMGSIEDFDLLAPTDLFLVSLQRENPLLNPFTRGRSHELELSHTFSNASFARMNLFRFSNGPSSPVISGEPLASSRFQGLETEFSTLLTSHLSLAVRARWLDARGQSLDPMTGNPLPATSLAALPKFDSELDLQYLNRKGFFIQLAQQYVAGRHELLAEGETVPRRSGGFGLTGLRIGKRSGLRSTIFLEVSNLFAKKYTITSRSLTEPQEGRRFRVGASLRF
ncbi:hypothetical protein IAD21_02464 [Abditibacteriota bacterium]|nr:hypothetical protein IAD21_02464 [Abditibacteriota bacterium]